MDNGDIRDFDYTDAAWESLYDAVDDTQFRDKDAQLIYNSLRHHLKIRSFGDYLKRYIYQKAEFDIPFSDVPLKDYQQIIKDAFKDNSTPCSFTSTTAKLSALSKNWLTQLTVKRNVVFLLGLGLGMSVDDVNMFLTKALREQEINPKEPFEVICWYCYKMQYNYLKFDSLLERYNKEPASSKDVELVYAEGTVNMRNTVLSIVDDDSLIAYLSKLKATANTSKISITARHCFDDLYNEARDLIAKMYNSYEDEEHSEALQEYINKLSRNDRLSDSDKQKRIEQFRSRKKVFSREDITESDIEHIICSAIPTDRHGNLTPSKASKLNEQFMGRRFSRQRISDILSEDADVTRFDLITLNFFVFSQKLDVYSEPKSRYIQFYDSMNAILEKCFLGRLYVQNPYECFVLMCVLSDDPLCTYADVWELSYRETDE